MNDTGLLARQSTGWVGGVFTMGVVTLYTKQPVAIVCN